ncbi:MAG: hypothetical protein R3230_00500 [Nitrosopumilaceae archaeon]|nr:hypothetical protein [Nitrosopumilaceae archaeon]
MHIHFCKSNGIAGLIIRFFTFSKWNHVAIQIGDNVYEATPLGVKRIPNYGFMQGWSRVTTINLEGLDESAAKKFLDKQLGKPYDWLALVALPFRKSWQSSKRWFCSELVSQALIHAGVREFKIDPWRITPRDLWLML